MTLRGFRKGDKPLGRCTICDLQVVERNDAFGTRSHIGWTRPEETWHDSVTEEDAAEEDRARFERFLQEEADRERKAREVEERQVAARALPSDGILHSFRIPSRTHKVLLQLRHKPFWKFWKKEKKQ